MAGYVVYHEDVPGKHWRSTEISNDRLGGVHPSYRWVIYGLYMAYKPLTRWDVHPSRDMVLTIGLHGFRQSYQRTLIFESRVAPWWLDPYENGEVIQNMSTWYPHYGWFYLIIPWYPMISHDIPWYPMIPYCMSLLWTHNTPPDRIIFWPPQLSQFRDSTWFILVHDDGGVPCLSPHGTPHSIPKYWLV